MCIVGGGWRLVAPHWETSHIQPGCGSASQSWSSGSECRMPMLMGCVGVPAGVVTGMAMWSLRPEEECRMQSEHQRQALSVAHEHGGRIVVWQQGGACARCPHGESACNSDSDGDSRDYPSPWPQSLPMYSSSPLDHSACPTGVSLSFGSIHMHDVGTRWCLLLCHFVCPSPQRSVLTAVPSHRYQCKRGSTRRNSRRAMAHGARSGNIENGCGGGEAEKGALDQRRAPFGRCL